MRRRDIEIVTKRETEREKEKMRERERHTRTRRYIQARADTHKH